MTEHERRLQQIRERYGYGEKHHNRRVYQHLVDDDIPWLLAEIERLKRAAVIIEEEARIGVVVTFEEAYEGATLVSAKDVADV